MEILDDESHLTDCDGGDGIGMPTAFTLFHLRNNLAWPPCNMNMIACNEDEGENVRLTLADWIPVPWDGKHWAYNAGRWSSAASYPTSYFSQSSTF